MTESIELMRAKLNTETAKTNWAELQPFFAKGQLILVDPQLDLIDVAAHIACDHAATVQTWMMNGVLSKLDDATATDWQQCSAAIWTVVIAPWILVQVR